MNGTDMLITATEGGINHWATIDKYPAETNGTRYATVTDNYDGTQYKVTAAGMTAAAKDVLKMYPNTQGAEAIRNDDIDAEAADMIFQVAALSTIVYG